MTVNGRLIEYAFPLKQASLDSVHEKNVRHGHISTLHIWPARRPLAACRAALIATLLPDPGTPEKRKELCEKIGGRIVKKIERKKMPNGQIVEREKEVTEGGILHWGRETENKEILDWFREEIRKAYGGRAPKVLDPFAGGGAIPLEAMRLGCEAIAIDINPVAWFILKCTLEYPQKLAGKTWALPEFILRNETFMRNFFTKAKVYTKTETAKALERLGRKLKEWEQGAFDFTLNNSVNIEADLAWHVRAWGQWVLDRARKELAQYYPVYADFEPLKLTGRDAGPTKPYEKQPMRLVPLKDCGNPDIDALNKEFGNEYLADKRNPRWVVKPTVAYLWARTVKCKNCRATIPLLKTRWLCKKEKKRVLLRMDVVHNPVGQASLPVYIYKRNLPHWRMEGACYFLTWRLHKQQAELGPEEKKLVVTAVRHFDGTRYRLHAFVVMNDHVHVIVETMVDWKLHEITHSWKSFTANQLQRQFHRKGAIWQDESFDRIVRDEAEYQEKMQYIANNPFKRWPEIESYSWVGFPKWEQEQKYRYTNKANQEETGTEACPTKDYPTISRVIFGIETDVPVKGNNSAQRREHDKRIGTGTMSRSGAKCPCCEAIMTMEDIRLEGKAGRLRTLMTAVVVEGQKGKEYRLPAVNEVQMAEESEMLLPRLFAQIPFGLPEEPLPSKEALGFRVPLYGFDQWKKLFTPRQLLALGTFLRWIRASREELIKQGDPPEKVQAINAYLACGFDRMLDFNSSCLSWITSVEAIGHTFVRYALPITWDYSESAIINYVRGSWEMSLEACMESYQTIAKAIIGTPLSPDVWNQSALGLNSFGNFDIVLTDPPYYDAISYSDLMDFFYVWLRRAIFGLAPNMKASFEQPSSPKWKNDTNDGELIDDASRHGGDSSKSKSVYEDGMARVFGLCCQLLSQDGLLVIVFAHKNPDAWGTLVSAIIRAGFVVDGSWPIQTEQVARMRAQASAALASSVWLVCKKRPVTARHGWDNQVLEEMRQNIRERLREFWDAGIRGPDFVWAATGPALEAYSKHPVVKKANDPGQVMTVSEFLTHVRRIVVDFVVGRVLSGDGVEAPEETAVDRLDEPTAYYLLHRYDFGLDEAPAGACILYAISCGISDRELAATWDLISFTKGSSTGVSAGQEEEESWEEEEGIPGTEAWSTEEESSGSKVKLKTWVQRKARSLGYETPGGKPIPLIDRVHCLMHLWKGGDLHKVDEYLDENGLRRQELFRRLLQSIIELSAHSSEERSLLESISNHIQARGAVKDSRQRELFGGGDD